MDKLLIVGTGSSVYHSKEILKNYSDRRRRAPAGQEPVKILCYSNSIEMFLEEDIDFDYWFFIDPTSAFKALKMIDDKYDNLRKAPFTFISPFGRRGLKDTSINDVFFGRDSFSNKYDDFIEETKHISTMIEEVNFIPIWTYRYIKNNLQHPLNDIDLDGKGAKYRFKQLPETHKGLDFYGVDNRVIFGSGIDSEGEKIVDDFHDNFDKIPKRLIAHMSPNNKQNLIKKYINNVADGFMNMCENKLTMCGLPVAQYLGAKKTYVLGFDGEGGRWDGLDDSGGVLEDSVLNEYYLNKWKKWKSFSGMSIYSVVEKVYTDKWTKPVINNILQYRRLEKLLKGELK